MSVTFEWSAEFSVGIPEIDEQHMMLFSLLNQLGAAIHEKHGSSACTRILDELVEYTRLHFALEESLMRLSGYPGLEAHKRLHRDLIDDVGVLRAKVQQGKAAISFELMQFLRRWLTRHILQSDQEYARCWKQSGSGGTRQAADRLPADVAPRR